MADTDEEDFYPRPPYRPPIPSLRVFTARIHRADSELRTRLRNALGEFNELGPDDEDITHLVSNDFMNDHTLPLNLNARDALLTGHVRMLKRLWRVTRDELRVRDDEYLTILEHLKDRQTKIGSLMNMMTAIDGNHLSAVDANRRLGSQIDQLYYELSVENSHYEQTLRDIEKFMSLNEDLVVENLQMVRLMKNHRDIIEKLQTGNWYDGIIRELRDYAFRILGHFLFGEYPNNH